MYIYWTNTACTGHFKIESIIRRYSNLSQPMCYCYLCNTTVWTTWYLCKLPRCSCIKTQTNCITRHWGNGDSCETENPRLSGTKNSDFTRPQSQKCQLGGMPNNLNNIYCQPRPEICEPSPSGVLGYVQK